MSEPMTTLNVLTSILSYPSGDDKKQYKDLEVRACPFCGSLKLSLRVCDNVAQVYCTACYAEGPNAAKYRLCCTHHHAEAIESWNRRVQRV